MKIVRSMMRVGRNTSIATTTKAPSAPWSALTAAFFFALLPTSTPARGADLPLVTEAKVPGFPLIASGMTPTIIHDAADADVVALAANDLADDLGRVGGVKPGVRQDPIGAGPYAIIVGTRGKNKLIDDLAAQGKLNVQALVGAWESFVIATVRDPAPGIKEGLVIVGSDRRGTAYGVYELAEAMGVSPWSWWADVTPRRKRALTVPARTRRFGPPSVKYRGIFINDEDWGLFPWAARTFEPERGNIGAKTYERVFGLLLRLKANTLWPAMHKTSAPFNADPTNAKLADRYAIVMGSSHAEPMLRNNVGEWKGTADQFNYAVNSQGVRAYWEERVKSNAAFESLWTLGMRGIHDSGIVGASTTAEKVKLVDRIIGDQRALLRQHVNTDLGRVQQMFVPYKEVLELYRNGLEIPEDVTLVWPDDNFGYIRQFPIEAERARSGGAGVYYHLSYLGAPLAYLWLSTTPPALVQEEMTRAYDRGMRTVWIANAGDIKPGEIALSHFMALAWNIGRQRGQSQSAFLESWGSRTFGAVDGKAIGQILDGYYRLNFERRPEHLQWPTRDWRGHNSSYTIAGADARLRRFDALVTATDAVQARMPPELQDAFFQLVGYPVRASAAANRRYFAAERYAELVDANPTMARSAGAAANAADREIKALTHRYNAEMAAGKWRHMMAEEPADPQWRSYRTAPVALPADGLATDPAAYLAAVAAADLSPPADVFEAEDGRPDHQWRIVDGLGRGKGALVAKGPGARVRLQVIVPAAGASSLELGLIPLFPDGGDRALRLDVAVDGRAPRTIEVPREADTPAWSKAVLDNLLRVAVPMTLDPGRHDVVVTARTTGIALDRVALVPSVVPH